MFLKRLSADEESCLLHQLLPRVLQQIANANANPEGGRGDAIDRLLNSVGVCSSGEADDTCGPLDLGDQAWRDILVKALGADELSPSEINQKRKNQTFAAFRDPGIVSKIIVLEEMVAPNVAKMRQLFERSEAVAKLHRLPVSAREERSEQSQKRPDYKGE